jgi:Protein of unknown function (DUF4019)
MIRRTFARFYFILLLASAFAGIAEAQDTAADARQFADAEWKLFDAGSFAKMYDATFDDSMKQTLTRDQWLSNMDTTAKQRGSMINRTLVNKTNSMGLYRFVYSTQCSGGKVFEDITVTKKGDGWKVVGIYVRPNLE